MSGVGGARGGGGTPGGNGGRSDGHPMSGPATHVVRLSDIIAPGERTSLSMIHCKPRTVWPCLLPSSRKPKPMICSFVLPLRGPPAGVMALTWICSYRMYSKSRPLRV